MYFYSLNFIDILIFVFCFQFVFCDLYILDFCDQGIAVKELFELTLFFP